MNGVLEHPEAGRLTAFGLGQLDEADSAMVESHLAECAACRAVVEGTSDDSLVSLLRSAASPEGSEQWQDTEGPSCGGGPSGPGLPAALAEHPRYRVQELLGVGGMGAVYKAEHQLMARPVALKVVNKALMRNPAAVERFEREVRAAAKLAHPNIVTAYDAEQAGDSHFLVMEYVEGMSLARLVAEQGPLPVARACDYVRQAALGLQHAHEQGMVHRDIKPHNLMLTPAGRVKILDFGLARFALESAPPASTPDDPDTTGPAAASLTDAGTVMGTPDYIAPEQVTDAHAADIRADIYSLGCTLYDLLAGHAPFPKGTARDKVTAHIEQASRPLTEIRGVPPGLARVVERMMAKDPARRYQTPRDVAEALAPFAVGPRRGPRGWLLVAAAAVLLVLVGPALWLYAPAVYRVATNQGELVIEVDDPNVEVAIRQTGVLVRDLSTKREYHLQPGRHDLKAGEYEIEVTDPDGVRLLTREFTIRRGDRVPVKVTLAAEGKPPPRLGLTTGEPQPPLRLGFTRREPPKEEPKPDQKPGDKSAAPDAAKLRRLLEQLGSDTFAEREAAAKELEAIGEPALDALRKAAASDDPDLRRRAGDLVRAVETRVYGPIRIFKGHTDNVTCVAFSPDGKRALSSSDDHSVRVWDVETGKELLRFDGHGDMTLSCAFSSDGKRAVSSSGWPPEPAADRIIRLWDAETGKQLRRFEGHKDTVWRVAFSPDGKRIVSASRDNTLRLWDVETGTEVRRFEGHTAWVRGAAFSPDGRRLVSGSWDHSVRIWDVETGQELKRLNGHGSDVNSVAWSPDGRYVLSGGGQDGQTPVDASLRLWDPATGKEVRRFDGHTRRVWSVTFSPDGKRILSNAADGTVRLWDPATGKPVLVYEGHKGDVRSAVFSPDGKRILSGAEDKTIRLWPVPAADQPGKP